MCTVLLVFRDIREVSRVVAGVRFLVNLDNLGFACVGAKVRQLRRDAAGVLAPRLLPLVEALKFLQLGGRGGASGAIHRQVACSALLLHLRQAFVCANGRQNLRLHVVGHVFEKRDELLAPGNRVAHLSAEVALKSAAVHWLSLSSASSSASASSASTSVVATVALSAILILVLILVSSTAAVPVLTTVTAVVLLRCRRILCWRLLLRLRQDIGWRRRIGWRHAGVWRSNVGWRSGVWGEDQLLAPLAFCCICWLACILLGLVAGVEHLHMSAKAGCAPLTFGALPT